jgi:hypothetical protein
MHDIISLITAVYQAYQILHPDAEMEEVEAWDADLHSEGNPIWHPLQAYAEICTECLVSVLADIDKFEISTVDLVTIGVAAGYYDRSYQVAKEFEEIRKIALEALGGHPPADNDVDELLAAIG